MSVHRDLLDHLLSVRGLTIEYKGQAGRKLIVSDIDIAVARGETVGIVGESGSGKSLTARAIVRLLPPKVHAAGEVIFDGRDLFQLSASEMVRLRGPRIAMLFQDPYTMLNPLRSCGKHISEVLVGPGRRRLKRRDRPEETLRRLREVGITDPGVSGRYPFELSGGMRQRVALAAALAQDPDVLIADEPSTALDVTTQAEILTLLKSLQQARGMAVILITHDLRVAFSTCDRIYVFYAGSVLEVAGADALEREPLHPYSLGLLLSEPATDRRLARLEAIEGTVATPSSVENVCAFSPRCRWATAECIEARPALREVELGRHTACARIDHIRSELRPLRQGLSELGSAVVSARTAHPLVRVDGLRKTFPGPAGKGVQALKGVSIEVGVNESVGLVGESGSGKTTIGRCLVGLETPTAGRIEIGGVNTTDFSSLTPEERTVIRRTVQIIFQDPYSSLDPMQTVGDTLNEVLRTNKFEKAKIDARVSELIHLVGLPSSCVRRRPSALSGGERQRVAIARALAVNPQIIVCDEPVSALDVSVQAQILNLFRDLREQVGVSYLFITHDLGVVRQVADHIYVLYRGEVVEEGIVDQVLDSPRHPYTARLVASIPRSAAQNATQ